jgi:hypothetical protein
MLALPSTRLVSVNSDTDHSYGDGRFDRSPQWTPHLLSFEVPEPGDERGEQHLATSVRGCLDCPSAGVVMVNINRWADNYSSLQEPMRKLGSLIGMVEYIGQSTLELKAGEEVAEVPWHINTYVSHGEMCLADWSALQIVQSSLEGGETGIYRIPTSLSSRNRRSFHDLLRSAGAQAEQGRMSIPDPMRQELGHDEHYLKVTIPEGAILIWNEHHVAHNRSLLRATDHNGSRQIVQCMGTL